MCFGGGSTPAPTPAPAPPAPAPLAEAVTPLTNYQDETAGQPGYNASGQQQLLRDPSTTAAGGAGVGTATTPSGPAAGLGPM